MPDQYWCWDYQALDSIMLSDNYKPTRFRIEYAKDPSDRETLLVNDDDVVISAFHDNGIAPLFVSSDGRLLNDYEKQTSFKFGALLHGLWQVDEGCKISDGGAQRRRMGVQRGTGTSVSSIEPFVGGVSYNWTRLCLGSRCYCVSEAVDLIFG